MYLSQNGMEHVIRILILEYQNSCLECLFFDFGSKEKTSTFVELAQPLFPDRRGICANRRPRRAAFRGSARSQRFARKSLAEALVWDF